MVKKINKKQKCIIFIAIITILVMLVLLIGVNIIRTNTLNSTYNSANNNSSSSNLLPEYIKEGITLGGVTGTLIDLDTSDATATEEDILWGKTAYVNGKKITGIMPIKQVKDLVAGEKIKYNTGNSGVGENGIVECIVLYDQSYNKEHGTNYGIQVVTADIIEKMSFGVDAENDSPESKECIRQYNEGILILNKVCEKYLNEKYATDARSVGSVPDNKNYQTPGYYTRSESWFINKLSNTFRNKDNNYITDMNQLKKLKIEKTSYRYWLASLDVQANDGWSGFGIRAYNQEEDIISWSSHVEINMAPNVFGHKTTALGVRAVFTLKPEVNIISGDGYDNAYIMEP